jgi:hypothetical protein
VGGFISVAMAASSSAASLRPPLAFLVVACMLGLMLGFTFTRAFSGSSGSSSSAAAEGRHEMEMLRQEAAALQQQLEGYRQELMRVDGRDDAANVSLIANNRGRGKNLRMLFENAAILLKYENPFPPVAQDISRYKPRFAVVPRELLDFEGMEPAFMGTWSRIRAHMGECQARGRYPQYNNMISVEDYCVAYSFIRTYQPKLVVEIGSGYSTRAIHGALRENRAAAGDGGGGARAEQVW